jgi:diguanylate cyclase (GGDEF)-like protein
MTPFNGSALPSRSPLSACARAAGRVVRGVISRPMVGNRPPRAAVLFSLLFGAVLAAVSVLHWDPSGDGIRTGLLALFVALAIAGDWLLIEIDDSTHFAAGDVFFAVTFLVLSPTESVITLLAVAGATALLRIPAWSSIFGWVLHPLGIVSCGLAASLAIQSLGLGVGTTAVLAVLGYFATVRLLDWVSDALIESPSLRPREVARTALASGKTLLATTPVEVPSALLGALAAVQFPVAAGLLVVPWVAGWLVMHQRAQLHEAQRQARQDPLTGLLNRAGLYEACVSREVRDLRGAHFAVLIGDLDNFKNVNDTLGHAVGDEVLRKAADAIRAAVGDEDVACRFGGEEFVVVAGRSSYNDIFALAEDIRERVHAAVAEQNSSISIGLAFRSGGQLDDLIANADKALYAAKYAGKNRVYEYTPTQSRPVRQLAGMRNAA